MSFLIAKSEDFGGKRKVVLRHPRAESEAQRRLGRFGRKVAVANGIQTPALGQYGAGNGKVRGAGPGGGVGVWTSWWKSERWGGVRSLGIQCQGEVFPFRHRT